MDLSTNTTVLELSSYFPAGYDYNDDEVSTTEPPYHLPRQVYFVMSGIVIHIGIIFNTLSFIVLASSVTLRRTSSGMYLIALSVADTTFLFGEFLRWLSNGRNSFNIDIDYMNTNLHVCKFINFLRYGGKITSAWLTVAITTERLMLVAFPLKHARLSTKFSTRLIICIIFVVSFVLGSYPFWSLYLEVKQGRLSCGYDEFWYEIGSWVSLRVGSLFLPGFIICIMTGCIIYFLTHAQQRRDRKLSSRRTTTIQRQNTMEVRKVALEKQLTVMLVAVAVAFLVLRLPYTIMYYLNEYKDKIWMDKSKWFYYRIYATSKIADTFATLNYAINFFLYYICGNVFRKQLKQVCTCAICAARGFSRQRSNMSSLPMTNFTHVHGSGYSMSRPLSPDSGCVSPIGMPQRNKRF